MSPLRGRVPTRLRNGLEISPGSNQASLSGRSLSCSLDELGLKYLNHRGQRAKPFDIDDRLLKISTTPENKERKWPLSSSPTSPCTVKHFPHKWAQLVSIFDYQHLSQMKAKVLLHLGSLLWMCWLTYSLGQRWCSAAAQAAWEEAQAPWGDTCCKRDYLQTQQELHLFIVLQGKPVRRVIVLSDSQQIRYIIKIDVRV